MWAMMWGSKRPIPGELHDNMKKPQISQMCVCTCMESTWVTNCVCVTNTLSLWKRESECHEWSHRCVCVRVWNLHGSRTAYVSRTLCLCGKEKANATNGLTDVCVYVYGIYMGHELRMCHEHSVSVEKRKRMPRQMCVRWRSNDSTHCPSLRCRRNIQRSQGCWQQKT